MQYIEFTEEQRPFAEGFRTLIAHFTAAARDLTEIGDLAQARSNINKCREVCTSFWEWVYASRPELRTMACGLAEKADGRLVIAVGGDLNETERQVSDALSSGDVKHITVSEFIKAAAAVQRAEGAQN